MRSIHSIAEANKILGAYVPLASKITGKDITLQRMWPLLERVGNPQYKLKVIHVAGTSGKTSTAYYLAALLEQTSQKVGLTVSPHVDSITERIQINGAPLAEDRFCAYLSEFMQLIDGMQPTYFELLIAFALWVFEREKIDYAVVEVGMGGLHDSTNVANRPDKVCVITDIGLDHTHVLGNTIPEIAAQKAGIIYEHNAVFCLRQSAEVMQVIRQKCAEQHATLHELTLEGEQLPTSLPLFQQRNWFLAKHAAEYVVERDKLPLLGPEQLAASWHTSVPARMEVVDFRGKTIIMDGAHNPQKMSALVASLRAAFPDQTFDVLIGMLSGKDLTETLKALQPVCGRLAATEFEAGQDMPRSSIRAAEVVACAEKLDFQHAAAGGQPASAFQQLVTESSGPILVTGSFFLLNYIRPLIFKA